MYCPCSQCIFVRRRVCLFSRWLSSPSNTTLLPPRFIRCTDPRTLCTSAHVILMDTASPSSVQPVTVRSPKFEILLPFAATNPTLFLDMTVSTSRRNCVNRTRVNLDPNALPSVHQLVHFVAVDHQLVDAVHLLPEPWRDEHLCASENLSGTVHSPLSPRSSA